ncbi:MAG: ParB/RepB/Spo0J family partition protein [Pirellulales bacterium]
MEATDVDIASLSPPATRPVADPGKLQRMDAFDWKKYTPIVVEKYGGMLIIQDGMTRVEAARRAGITTLPAFVFEAK